MAKTVRLHVTAGRHHLEVTGGRYRLAFTPVRSLLRLTGGIIKLLLEGRAT